MIGKKTIGYTFTVMFKFDQISCSVLITGNMTPFLGPISEINLCYFTILLYIGYSILIIYSIGMLIIRESF